MLSLPDFGGVCLSLPEFFSNSQSLTETVEVCLNIAEFAVFAGAIHNSEYDNDCWSLPSFARVFPVFASCCLLVFAAVVYDSECD